MSTSRFRVLVVFGEESTAAAIGAALERRGHSVRCVSSARGALEAGTHDVLVCDLSTAGFALLPRLHAAGIRPHTVFLADSPTLDQCRHAIRMGAIELLQKPFRLEELLRAVESCPRAQAPNQDAWEGAFELVYAASPACVEAAARDVAAYALRCGVRPATRARIASATSEVVDNARRHGYAHRRGGIELSARASAREFVVSVRDEGLGFDTAYLSARALHDTLRSGLARALALCEDMQVTSAPGCGTSVRLAFAAHAVAFDDEAGVDLSELDFLTPDLTRRVLHTLTRPDTASLFRLSPALSVVVGRLVTGAEPHRCLDTALWS